MLSQPRCGCAAATDQRQLPLGPPRREPAAGSPSCEEGVGTVHMWKEEKEGKTGKWRAPLRFGKRKEG